MARAGMKAKTKGEKIKAKRGRPRLPATDRQPNGQPSRRKASIAQRQQDQIMNVAISRRIRDYGLTDIKIDGKLVTAEKQAIDPKRGYVLGLLYLDGRITEDQHEAGLRYAQDIARYHGLTGVPFPSPRAQNLFAVHGDDGEVSETRAERAAKARKRMQRLRDALLAVGNIDTGRRVIHAVNEVVLLDNVASRTWPDHMLTYLRRGLNKLMIEYSLS